MTTTSISTLIKNIDAKWLKEFSSSRGEPEWLWNLRLEALTAFEALPWPTKTDERWKRTEISQLKWDHLEFSETGHEKASQLSELAPELSQFRGSYPSQGEPHFDLYWDIAKGTFTDVNQPAEEGTIGFFSFEDGLKRFPEKLKAALASSLAKARSNKFLLLSYALMNGGVCLVIPKNNDIRTPIRRFVAGPKGHNAFFTHTFILLEEGARAQLWEDLIGVKDHDGAFLSSVTTVFLSQNSSASFYNLQQWGDNLHHFQFHDITQEAHSRFNAIAISVGGRIFHHETSIHLNGEGAENKVLGLLFGDDQQNFENWIHQHHNAPRTVSDIQYRGALKGESRSFFSGLVSIIKQAQQSNAYQSAKSMLLSNGARADTIPNLEILADDVKCSHGAAVGPVDEEQKFYLESRGLSPQSAENVIVQGFFEPVIAEVPTEIIQDRLRHFVEEKLLRGDAKRN